MLHWDRSARGPRVPVTRRVLSVFVVGALVGAAIASAVALSVASSPSNATTSRGDYLALGDSVSFGYRESNTLPPPVYTDPADFTGFPEDVAGALGMNVTNAACRGASSGQLLHSDVSALGCPLHVPYTGTQVGFATRFLSSHPATTLVTLMIGINDALQCQADTRDHCASELTHVLTELSENVATILTQIRDHYAGTIVVVNYYPLTYNGADYSASVNHAVDEAAAPFHVRVANGWSAFVTAAAPAGGDECAAGLLTQLVSGGCGIHPSPSGQALLALSVEEAIRADTTTTTSTPPATCPKGWRVGLDGKCVAG